VVSSNSCNRGPTRTQFCHVPRRTRGRRHASATAPRRCRCRPAAGPRPCRCASPWCGGRVRWHRSSRAGQAPPASATAGWPWPTVGVECPLLLARPRAHHPHLQLEVIAAKVALKDHALLAQALKIGAQRSPVGLDAGQHRLPKAKTNVKGGTAVLIRLRKAIAVLAAPTPSQVTVDCTCCTGTISTCPSQSGPLGNAKYTCHPPPQLGGSSKARQDKARQGEARRGKARRGARERGEGGGGGTEQALRCHRHPCRH
jgi:hypothetical protein